jgi:hypothetical protein
MKKTTTTIRDVIKMELIKTCKEVTARLREKDEKKDKKRKFSREDVQKIEILYTALGWKNEFLSKMMEAASILHDAPELKQGGMINMELFCVFVLGKTTGTHAYNVNEPLIHTASGKNVFGALHVDATVNNWSFVGADLPRYATDEEVEKCINSLNQNQWNSILTHDIFKPIIEAAMSKSVEIEEAGSGGNEENGSDNGEAVVIAGRKFGGNDDE